MDIGSMTSGLATPQQRGSRRWRVPAGREALIETWRLPRPCSYFGSMASRERRWNSSAGRWAGLSSTSFYVAFGSKEALYREAVALYLATHGQVMAALRDTSLPPRACIEQALRGSVAMQTASSHPSSCLITLSAMMGSQSLPPIRNITADERRSNREAILACVEEGVSNGTLQAGSDVSGLAALFEELLVGLSIQSRDGVDGVVIDAAVIQAMRLWDANREV